VFLHVNTLFIAQNWVPSLVVALVAALLLLKFTVRPPTTA
jgi:hypothetical protein